MQTARVRIEGRVQGVGYRVWARRTAIDLGLCGWVRNREDGSVEAVFQGPEAQVADMIARCKAGPRGAIVKHVEVLAEGVGAFEGFEVRETA